MDESGCDQSQPILNCKLTIYSPKLFRDVLDSYFDKVDFARSLCVLKNASKIKKLNLQNSGEGGKSGQLFFLTHDRRLILKTTDEEEAKVFLKGLYDYSEHFRKNPKSQIGRIFGLFDVKFEDAGGRNIKLFVMEALDPRIKNATLRKYDLKGSDHDRKVLQSYNNLNKKKPIFKILKDIDFQNIDVNFGISYSQKREILASIKKDLEFFKKHKIIDYSLIVSVVDKSKLPVQYLFDEKKNGNYRLLESIEDPNIAYFIGIIDYFQLYGVKKKLERWFKRLSKCNFRLETSSQPPSRYATRFDRKITQYFYEVRDTRAATLRDLGSTFRPTFYRNTLNSQFLNIDEIHENMEEKGGKIEEKMVEKGGNIEGYMRQIEGKNEEFRRTTFGKIDEYSSGKKNSYCV